MTGKALRKIIQQLLSIFCIPKKVLPASISNHNSTREKQIILLMIPKKKKKKMDGIILH